MAAVRKLRIDMPDCARPLAAPTAASANDRAAASLAPHAERGPFRPEVWRNARQRSTVRLAAYYFRAADVLAVVGLAVVALWSLGSLDVKTLTVGAVRQGRWKTGGFVRADPTHPFLLIEQDRVRCGELIHSRPITRPERIAHRHQHGTC